MRFMIDIPEDEADDLLRRAIMAGFMRESPRRAWTTEERKEAIRWYFLYLADKDRRK